MCQLQIYYASEEFGLHNTRASGGYYHMAEVFEQQGDVIVAQSLYRQVRVSNDSRTNPPPDKFTLGQ